MSETKMNSSSSLSNPATIVSMNEIKESGFGDDESTNNRELQMSSTNQFTEVIGEPVPFQAPVMKTDEQHYIKRWKEDLQDANPLSSSSSLEKGEQSEDAGTNVDLRNRIDSNSTHGHGHGGIAYTGANSDDETLANHQQESAITQALVMEHLRAFSAVVGDAKMPFLVPNASDNKSLFCVINGEKHSPRSTSALGSYVVAQDEFAFVERNGNVEILSPGRYMFPHWRDNISPLFKQSDSKIISGPVSIIQISPGEYGLATHNGFPVYLLPGRHAYKGNFKYFSSVKQSDGEILFKTHTNAARILTVSSGCVAVVSILGKLKLFGPGRFGFTEPTIQFLRLIDLQSGSASLLSDGNQNDSHLAGGGGANNGQPQLQQAPHGQRDTNSIANVLCGTVTFVRIGVDELGLAQDHGRLVVLLPGLHLHNDAGWVFIRRFKINSAAPVKHKAAAVHQPGVAHPVQQVLDSQSAQICGPLKIFSVHPGYIRAIRDNSGSKTNLQKSQLNSGAVKILAPGRYCINHPNIELADEIDMQNQQLTFNDSNVMMSGGVLMQLTGVLRYQVEKPEVMIQQMGFQNLEAQMQSICKAEVSQVCASVTFESVSAFQANPSVKQSEEVSISGPNAITWKAGQREGGATRSVICEHIINALTRDAAIFGVKVLGFQIDDIGLADPASKKAFLENNTALARATAEQRIQQINASTALKQAEIDQKQKIVEAETKNRTTQLQAEQERNKLMTDTKAKTDSQALAIEADNKNKIAQQEAVLRIETLKIETDAKNRLTKAKADAEAIVIAADAAYQAKSKEAEGIAMAIKLKGDAENKVSKEMPPQWKEIQLASIQAKMFESCMGKIDHVNVTESSLLLQTMLAPLFNRGVSWLAGGGATGGVGQPLVNSMAAPSSSSSSVPMTIK